MIFYIYNFIIIIVVVVVDGVNSIAEEFQSSEIIVRKALVNTGEEIFCDYSINFTSFSL